MTDTSSERDPVEALAEEFLERFRRGERPALSEYTDQYPALADQIRDLFPALVMMEDVRADAAQATGPQADDAALAEGRPLERLGDFRILREVGRGGMGIVYEAEQESLGRHVALKVLPSHALLDPQKLRRFQREAKAAARLHHTNIVPVYGVGEADGLQYYVMQFIQGMGLDEVVAELRRLRQDKTGAAQKASSGSRQPPSDRTGEVSVAALAQSLRTGQFQENVERGTMNEEQEEIQKTSSDEAQRPAPSGNSSFSVPHSSLSEESGRPYWQSVARIGIQVAQALAYATSQGILHRDIKPSNLLLDTHGTVWVTDFGLVKMTTDQGQLTHTGDIVGTVRYMAPERFEGQADVRSDLYSLGLTLYELLTLRPAFQAADRNQLVHQVMHEEPPRPRKLNPEVPRDLETVVLKAMARDPASRYQTAGELAEDLTRFVEDRPIRARPVSLARRAILWARRRPAAAALLVVSGVAALALVAAGVGAAYNLRLREAQERTERALQAQAEATKNEETQRQRAEAALEQARYYQYFHHIALAHAGWREGNLARVEQLLEDCPVDRRHWEWHYLKRLCHADLLTIQGHTQALRVAYSPDGTHLASAGYDQVVKIWDAVTGQAVHTLGGHSGEIDGLAYSPDGTRLASASWDGTVRIWDTTTGEEIRALKDPTAKFRYLVYSPDGTRLASMSLAGTVKIWEATTGQLLRTLPRRGTQGDAVAFSPDGTRLASTHQDGRVWLWNATTGQEISSLKGSGAKFWAVAFSPDGVRLAAGNNDGTSRIWNVATGQLMAILQGHTAPVMSVAFSPDGDRLASSGNDQTVRVWDAWTGQELRTLRGHTGAIEQVAFHPEGNRLASASGDGTVKVWDPMMDQEATRLQGHTRAVVGIAFDSEGSQLASASSDRTVKIWDATTGQALFTLRGHSNTVLGVAFSPDRRQLASSSRDPTIRVWDPATGHVIRTLIRHSEPVDQIPMPVNRIAYSGDGQWLASRGDERTVRIWAAATGQLVRVLTGHSDWVCGVAFSPDGTRLASTSLDKTVRIWDTATGAVLHTLQGHDASVFDVAFSPDGHWLASASDNGAIKVWETATGQLLRTLQGHAGTVINVAFSPDGKRLVSGSHDQTVKVWEAATGQEILSLKGHTGGAALRVAFSPDGTRIANGGGENVNSIVKIWDGRPWTPDAVIEREAVAVLGFLFTKPLCRADVLDYLRSSPMLRPAARQLALALADRYQEASDPERYQQAAWSVLRQPHLNAFQYRFALRQAETACRLLPGQHPYLTTLGMAQYRAGQYPEAVATLAQADLLHRATPASLAFLAGQLPQGLVALRQAEPLQKAVPMNLAFLAMTQHALGQPQQAQETLARLRQLLQQPGAVPNEDAQRSLREAEERLAGMVPEGQVPGGTP